MAVVTRGITVKVVAVEEDATSDMYNFHYFA